jgi:beta-galactosidase
VIYCDRTQFGEQVQMTSVSDVALLAEAGTALSDARSAPLGRWPAGQRGNRVLRYGGDYNPEQWPEEVWAEDVQLMRQAGVNLVSVGIFSWAMIEPREGEYDFRTLDRILDMLADGGIDVDLGTPTAAPPAWFWRAYPQSRPVTRDGVQLGFGSRGMVSPSSLEYRRAAVAIADQLAARYRSHPALAMWHVHNEYGTPITEDYSDNSVRAFREWLQNRYGDLDNLNQAWGTTFWGQTYGDWEEVDAPRRSATVTNPAQRLDFARFSNAALLECFRAERDAIRAHTPGLPITTNFMATSCPSVDYWTWADEVDVVANDHYLVAERGDNHILLAMGADLTRSLARGRPYLLMEHSTSAVNWQPRNLAKRPGEMRRNGLSYLARGADAIMFFQFRASLSGAEKFHSAMLPHAGTDTRVWRQVVALGQELVSLAAVRGSRVPARVAVVWDWESFWAQDLDWRPSVDLDHRDRTIAFYSALWRRGVQVDFVHPDQELANYDLTVVPSLYLCKADTGTHLTRYVRDGGRCVISYFSGIVDHNDTVHPGGYPGPLSDLLGLRIEEFLPFAAGETADLHGQLVEANPNGCGTGSVWADMVQLSTAQPLLTFKNGRAAGQPAVSRNAFGAGSAWYVATNLDVGSMDSLIDRVLAEAGLSAPLQPEGLERVVRVAEDRSFEFLINHSDNELTVSVEPHQALSVPAHGAVVHEKHDAPRV